MITRTIKRHIALFLVTALLAAMFVMVPSEGSFATTEETRGVWVAFNEFSSLGLKDVSKSKFKKNFGKILDKGKYNGCNTVFFHVRICDDAAWKSKTFPATQFLTSKASRAKTAASTFTYDPLKVACELAHNKGFKIEGWMNPYRVDQYHRVYLNPGSKYSTSRINRAIDELQKYDLDGIHFDDFFYHSKGYYRWTSKDSRYYTSAEGPLSKAKPDAETRRSNVNKMIRSVYKNVHEKEGWVFGISPAGNVDNCMNAGADVKKWLSKTGYVDYIAPQLYWSNKYGSYGNIKMYTDRLSQWTKLNKLGVRFYAGLALYRAGVGASGDYGWRKSDKNIANQIKLMRKYKGNGYILFKASDFTRSGAAKELKNLRKLIEASEPATPAAPKPTVNKPATTTVTPEKTKVIKLKMTVKKKKSKTIKYKKKALSSRYKKIKFKSADKSIATVSRTGKVKGKKKGTTTITATVTKSGVKIKFKVKVKVKSK